MGLQALFFATLYFCVIRAHTIKPSIVVKITNNEHVQYLRAIWSKQLAANSGTNKRNRAQTPHSGQVQIQKNNLVNTA